MKGCLFALVATGVALAWAESPKKIAEITVPRVFKPANGQEFRFRWHEPAQVKPGEKYPLVILLHGAGERGTNNVAQLIWGGQPIADWFQKRGKEFYFIAGQVPNGQKWVEVPWEQSAHTMPKVPSHSMAGLIALVEKLLASKLPIDSDRVYATGISMGGYGTWDLIARKTEWFAGAMPICGGADVRQAVKLRDLPIWVHHGDADSAVPVWRARSMIAALRYAGSNVARYTEYPGCGHFSWGPAYGNEKNLDWLFGLRRVKRPEWEPAEGALKAGQKVPARHFEAAFEFTTDGGATWHTGLVRKVPGFPLMLVDDRVMGMGLPYDFETAGGHWKLTSPKGADVPVRFRNVRARALPEWK